MSIVTMMMVPMMGSYPWSTGDQSSTRSRVRVNHRQRNLVKTVVDNVWSEKSLV